MERFPSARHLASWAGLCPDSHESAGKQKSGKTRRGNPAVRASYASPQGQQATRAKPISPPSFDAFPSDW